ncbi:two-component system, cell cycle response regulator [Nitratiruptor sp. YY08-26]|uniref:GGDEF domain-containing protein n=1 Tax=unclassified Nitratiruptor TaxID=2624044 RepID=UPI001915B97F|nr:MULTISPECIES: GGDEF domain-containing protein [unclassified Nitratiruptor]BCD61971.1 two-component system, cell cycle response regulator [Nitratiruptor sp. YY08-13]BCD65907.1 two-component system, cell cycle response regulator [Nitratiruptor sp. YY08-26]
MKKEKIAIFFHNKNNEKLLYKYLSDKYEILFDAKLNQDEKIDLIIIDGVCLKKYQYQIEKLKEEEKPVFLPILLVTTKKDIHFNKNEIFQLVNDVIIVPIISIELHMRLYNLLYIRELTLILEKESSIDPLTGVFNRRAMNEMLIAEIEKAKRYKRPLSVIFFDIDHFKKINDTYGHDVGDFVLRKLVSVIRNHLRQTDTLARFGGEEFLIVLPEMDLQNTKIVAEKIRKRVETTDFEKVKKITISLGVTQLKEDDTRQELLKRVDEALYQAKNSGRNKVVTVS